ncbi:MAG: hypothetical protein ACKVWV_19445, partial [Planctomycetota bacterium]
MKPDDAERGLDAALRDLAAIVHRRRVPTHRHARALLLALGEHVLAGRAEEADEYARKITELVRDCDADWKRAVGEELALACDEFVRSVDPRYLTLPRYDFVYTVAARERLEIRFAAASHLELAPAEHLLEEVARADLELEPFLRRRRGEESP